MRVNNRVRYKGYNIFNEEWNVAPKTVCPTTLPFDSTGLSFDSVCSIFSLGDATNFLFDSIQIDFSGTIATFDEG